LSIYHRPFEGGSFVIAANNGKWKMLNDKWKMIRSLPLAVLKRCNSGLELTPLPLFSDICTLAGLEFSVSHILIDAP